MRARISLVSVCGKKLCARPFRLYLTLQPKALTLLHNNESNSPSFPASTRTARASVDTALCGALCTIGNAT